MTKNILFAAMSIAFATTGSLAFADTPYVGAGLGVTGFFDKVKETGTPSGSFNDGTLGAIANVFAGYAFDLSNKYALGIEGFMNHSTAKIREDVSSIPDVTTTKYRYSYGLRAFPTYKVLSNADMHVILGYTHGEFNLQDTHNNLNKNFSANGYQFGLGSCVSLTQNLSLRGDIIYSDFQKRKTTANTGSTFENQISTFDGFISLAYSFN